MGEIGLIQFIDFFAHLEELEVQKYLPSFPYWSKTNSLRRKKKT